MIYNRYLFESSPDFLTFEFESIGLKGQSPKLSVIPKSMFTVTTILALVTKTHNQTS